MMSEWPATPYSVQQLIGEIHTLDLPLPVPDAAHWLALGLEQDRPAALALLLQSIETLARALQGGSDSADTRAQAGAGAGPATGADLLRSCMIRGLTAQAIARRCPLADVGPLCGIGMLADIGHLLLRHLLPQATAQALRLARTSDVALHRLQRRLLGFDFAEAGAALALSWALPDRHALVIGAQTDPRLAGRHQTEARIIALAGLIVEHELIGAAAADTAATAGLASWWSALGLDARCLHAVHAEVCAGLDGALSAVQAFILHDEAAIAG